MTHLDRIELTAAGGGIRCVVSSVLVARLQTMLGAEGQPREFDMHAAMTLLLRIADAPQAGEPAAIERLRPHLGYYREKLEERRIDPLAIWAEDGTVLGGDDIVWLEAYLPEFLRHLAAAVAGAPAEIRATEIFDWLVDRAAHQSSPAARALVPRTVLGLPSEANLAVIMPWFEKSLAVPGDICEFGCFRGVNSVKFAFMVKAAGLAKTVYAFDTFEGFAIADPGGGALGAGSFSDTHEALDDLTKWSKVLPLVPIAGDATVTAARISAPLSFVWLDLDMGVLLDPVLRHILPWIGPETIVGLDDVGRPETPTVEPWIDAVVGEGLLVEIGRDEPAFIRFYRRG